MKRKLWNSTLNANKGLNKISPKTAERNNVWHKVVMYCEERYAKGLCEIRATDECKARIYKPDWRGLSGHHIISRARGGNGTENNCIIGCGDCHNHSVFSDGTPLPITELHKIISRRRVDKLYQMCNNSDTMSIDDLITPPTTEETYIKTYRMQATGAGGKTIRTSVPSEVVAREARRQGVSIEKFVKQFKVQWLFNGFEGAWAKFIPKDNK